MARLTGRRGYLLYMLKQTSSTSDTSISDELAKEHLMYNCLQSSLRASMQKVINDVCLVGDTDKVVNENCENICRRYRELLDQIKHLDVTINKHPVRCNTNREYLSSYILLDTVRLPQVQSRLFSIL
ncbi:hypothetical protein GJ496_007596 [Pomphorhynchus laevis]|nr:hypothetical protein GJ496_007596 [Pomphorhynchus laevis]